MSEHRTKTVRHKAGNSLAVTAQLQARIERARDAAIGISNEIFFLGKLAERFAARVRDKWPARPRNPVRLHTNFVELRPKLLRQRAQIFLDSILDLTRSLSQANRHVELVEPELNLAEGRLFEDKRVTAPNALSWMIKLGEKIVEAAEDAEVAWKLPGSRTDSTSENVVARAEIVAREIVEIARMKKIDHERWVAKINHVANRAVHGVISHPYILRDECLRVHEAIRLVEYCGAKYDLTDDQFTIILKLAKSQGAMKGRELSPSKGSRPGQIIDRMPGPIRNLVERSPGSGGGFRLNCKAEVE